MQSFEEVFENQSKPQDPFVSNVLRNICKMSVTEGNIIEDDDSFTVEKTFVSLEAFHSWKKKNIATSLLTKFGKKRSTNNTQFMYYNCRRFQFKQNQKNEKVLVPCPCKMTVEVNQFFVHARYSDLEHNHPVPKLSPSDRTLIRKRLSQGMMFSQIQDELSAKFEDVRAGFIVNGIINAKRLMQERKLKLFDFETIHETIDPLKTEEFNPIIIYKPLNHVCFQGSTDLDEFASLFVIGLQDEKQFYMLKENSEQIVCIDTDFIYDFHLINIIVSDEFGNGYPVAHFIVNKMDRNILKILIRSLKNRYVENNIDIKVNAVLSNDVDINGEVFREVFGEQVTYFVCSKMIYENLETDLEIVTNLDVRQKMKDYLGYMKSEQYIDGLQNSMIFFNMILMEKCPNLKMRNFEKLKKSCLWGTHCHNLSYWKIKEFCEVFHQNVALFKVDNVKSRVVCLLSYLYQLVEKIYQNPHIFQINEKGTDLLTPQVVQISKTFFVVKLKSAPSEYVVKIKEFRCENCDKKCHCCEELCGDMYSCSCLSRELTVCKHIHNIHEACQNLSQSMSNQDINGNTNYVNMNDPIDFFKQLDDNLDKDMLEFNQRETENRQKEIMQDISDKAETWDTNKGAQNQDTIENMDILDVSEEVVVGSNISDEDMDMDFSQRVNFQEFNDKMDVSNEKVDSGDLIHEESIPVKKQKMDTDGEISEINQEMDIDQKVEVSDFEQGVVILDNEALLIPVNTLISDFFIRAVEVPNFYQGMSVLNVTKESGMSCEISRQQAIGDLKFMKSVLEDSQNWKIIPCWILGEIGNIRKALEDVIRIDDKCERELLIKNCDTEVTFSKTKKSAAKVIGIIDDNCHILHEHNYCAPLDDAENNSKQLSRSKTPIDSKEMCDADDNTQTLQCSEAERTETSVESMAICNEVDKNSQALQCAVVESSETSVELKTIDNADHNSETQQSAIEETSEALVESQMICNRDNNSEVLQCAVVERSETPVESTTVNNADDNSQALQSIVVEKNKTLVESKATNADDNHPAAETNEVLGEYKAISDADDNNQALQCNVVEGSESHVESVDSFTFKITDLEKEMLNYSFNVDDVYLTVLDLKSLDTELPEKEVSILLTTDYHFQKGWLTPKVIDAYLKILCTGNSRLTAVSSLCKELLQSDIKPTIPNNWMECEKLLIPYNPFGKHWILFMYDVKMESYEYFNPMEEDDLDIDEILLEINALLMGKFESIAITRPPHIKQAEDINCGVFICHYSKQTANGLTFEDSFDVKQFRREIYKTIVQNCIMTVYRQFPQLNV